MNIGEDFKLEDIDLSGEKSLADKWILTRLNDTVRDVTRLSDDYEFGEVGRLLYNFIWDDFCDWYIEMAKVPMTSGSDEDKHMTRSVLLYTLDKILKMLHPFMPFVTDEIYQAITKDQSIVVSEYPVVDDALSFENAKAEMELLVGIIKSVRTTRNEVNTPLSKPIVINIEVKDDARRQAVERNKHYIERFTNPETLSISSYIEKHDDDKTDVVKGATVVLPLAGLINKEEEIARLENELKRLDGELKRVKGKLSNEKFVSNAPEKIVEEERQKEAGYQGQYDEVAMRLSSLKGE